MAWARMVAVVVPSPATSLVRLATSRTIWAPMFWNLSSSSISLATVTPSLVTMGEPKLLSMITLRPLGPRVTLTASASALTPSRIDFLATSSYCRIFAPIYSILLIFDYFFSMIPSTSSSLMMRYSTPSILTSLPPYLLKRIRSPFLTSMGMTLPSSVSLPLPAATTSPSVGLSFAVSGMMIPPLVFSSSAMRLTMILSYNGLIFILKPPFLLLIFFLSGLIADPVGSGLLLREIRGIYMHGLGTVKGKDEIFQKNAAAWMKTGSPARDVSFPEGLSTAFLNRSRA